MSDKQLKQQHINNVMDRVREELRRLYSDDPVEAHFIGSAFLHNLETLTLAQLKVVDDPDIDVGTISHDVAGIANQDRHFLPRIRALHRVTPYLI